MDYFWFKVRPRYELADRAHLSLIPSAVRPRTPLNLPSNVINAAVDRENLPEHPNKPRDGILTHGVALQRHNTENSKQIFPEKELRGHSPNIQIHLSVSEIYILTIDLPILQQEICGPILGI